MTEADVREMVSVICALEMDSDTISAILFLMKMIMMSASRDLSPRNGEESLRDLFSERPETGKATCMVTRRQTYYLKEKSSIKIKLTNTRFVLTSCDSARLG